MFFDEPVAEGDTIQLHLEMRRNEEGYIRTHPVRQRGVRPWPQGGVPRLRRDRSGSCCNRNLP